MKNKIGLALATLILSQLSYADIGENSWDFQLDETIGFDFRNNYPSGIGAEYACYKFTPERVSFMVQYVYPFWTSKYPIHVSASGGGKVKQDDIHHIITVTNATGVSFQFPARGIYHITNTTGTAVHGSKCDTGDYG